ncbi:glycosyltransferase family 4 protein [Leifsonia sp. NPDC056824]|uniref:glycosyltransferase family 4 protein n=1 Tax=Leifsonia sp. NPDC056824 TaxID=3345953 RepID=UPI0036B551B1
MPRILVDLLFLTGGKGGMESYVRELYSAMPPGDVEFAGLISREAEGLDLGWFPGELVRSGVSGENRVAWARGELTALSGWVRRTGAALVHSPANVGPLRAPVPVVLTVHDLLPFVHPEWVPGRYAGVLRWMIRRAARNAAEVVTVSEASRADIVRVLGVDPSRVTAIPLAGRATAQAATGSGARDIVLTVGNRMPHKNVETVFEAYARLAPAARPRLVVTGGAEGDPLRLLAGRLGIAGDVDFVGWVSEAELEALYARAALVVVPSRFEGFGLPVLEAMSRGAAVVCADIPPLREVAGDAAVFVPPTDTAQWAAAIARLWESPDQRAQRAEQGLNRAGGFSWERTSRRTLEVFQRVLAAR